MGTGASTSGIGGTGCRCALASAGPASCGQRGFTYLGVLFVVVLMGIGLAGAGQFWSLSSQRDKEVQLLWVGSQYVRALRAYHARSPGRKAWPLTLDELLEDRRFPTPVRHLRRPYRDPLAPSLDWQLIRNSEGRIVGVHSQAPGVPLKQANFPLLWEDFAGTQSYADWRFVADAALRGPRANAEGTVPSPSGEAAGTGGTAVGR